MKIIVYVVDLIARVGDWFITRYANRLGGEECMSDPYRCDTCGKDIPLNAVSYSHGQGKPWYCSFDCMNGGDNVSHPAHYKWLPVEAIEITEHFNFCMGNALKYLIRADHKGKPVEDLRKALFYIKRELRNRGYEGDL